MLEGGAVFFSSVLVQYARRYKALDDVLDRSRNQDGSTGQGWEEYLDLGEEVEDDDDGVEGGPEAYSQESHGAMPATGLMSGIPAKGLEVEPEDTRTWLPSNKK